MKYNFFDLDLGRLDEEWLAQPRLYWKFADKLASARAEWEKTKAQLDLVVAQTHKAVRDSPEDYGLGKVTETGVTQTVILQPKVVEARGRVIEAKLQVDRLAAVVDGLEHRKKALESMVYLQGQGYIAEPRVRGNRDATEDMRIRARRRRPEGKSKES